MLRQSFLTLLSSIIQPPTKTSPSAPNTGSASQEVPRVSRAALPSGLRLVVAENPRSGLAGILLRVRVGSGAETPETNGHAHFLEHLLFKGSADRKPGDYDRTLERLGGEFTARTTRDYTEYSATLPADKALEALPLFAELVQKPAFRPEDIEQERAVIRREMAAADSEPLKIGYRCVYSGIFEPGHPYHLPLMGTPESLEKTTLESLRSFWQTAYQSDRMTLVVSGAVSAKAVRHLVEPLFPPPATPQVPAPEARVTLPLGRILRIEEVPANQQPRRDLTTLYFAFRLPPTDVELLPLMDALMVTLGTGRSGRLGSRLVVEDKVALNVTTEYLPGMRDSLILVEATTLPRQVAALEKAFEAEIRRMREDPITAIESETARVVALGRMRYVGETVEGRARQLAQWDQFAPGLTDDAYQVKMSSLRKEDLQIAVRRFLTPLSFAIATVGSRPTPTTVSEGGQL